MNPKKWLVTYGIIGGIIFAFIGFKLLWPLFGNTTAVEETGIVFMILMVGIISVLSSLVFTSLMWVTLGPVFLITIEGKQVLIDLQSKVIINYPEKTFFWKRQFKKISQGCRLMSYALRGISLEMNCRPITPNPKVRELAYTIRGHFLGSIEQLKDFLKEFGYKHEEMGLESWEKWQNLKKGVERFIKFHLYELNETLSTKLGEFYNPFNPQQQAEFKKLVLGFLAPKIENKGITITDISFGLAA